MVSELDVQELQTPVDWINELEAGQALEEQAFYCVTAQPKEQKVLLKGGCFLVALHPVIDESVRCHVEVNRNSRRSHTMTLLNILSHSPDVLRDIQQDVPWMDSNQFESSLRDSSPDVLILDMIDEYMSPLYRDRKTGMVINVPFGFNPEGKIMDEILASTYEPMRPLITPEVIDRFVARFEYLGPGSVADTADRLQALQQRLNCQLIVINRPGCGIWETELVALTQNNRHIQVLNMGDHVSESSILADGEHLDRMSMVIVAKKVVEMLTGKQHRATLAEIAYAMLPSSGLALFNKKIRPQLGKAYRQFVYQRQSPSHKAR